MSGRGASDGGMSGRGASGGGTTRSHSTHTLHHLHHTSEMETGMRVWEYGNIIVGYGVNASEYYVTCVIILHQNDTFSPSPHRLPNSFPTLPPSSLPPPSLPPSLLPPSLPHQRSPLPLVLRNRIRFVAADPTHFQEEVGKHCRYILHTLCPH